MSQGDAGQPVSPASQKCDVNEEAPKWTLKRMFMQSTPLEKGPKEWTPIGTQPKSSSDPDWRGVIRDNVIELPMPEPYKYGQPSDPKYYWFDTPDYADPFKKLGYCLKISIGIGLICGTACATFTGLKPCMKNHFYIAKRFVVPWTAAIMSGGATVITTANLRGKKDDTYNYLAGGAVTGLILGRKGWVSATRSMILVSAAAIYIKWMAEVNGYLIPLWNRNKRNMGLHGMSNENGLATGDLRLGFRTTYGDPGRDVRSFDT